MKKMKLVLLAIAAMSLSNSVVAQWTTTGSDIYNTNLFTGKVGIGKIPTPNDPVGPPPYYFQAKTPFLQVHGPSGGQSLIGNPVLPLVGLSAANFTSTLGFGFNNQYAPAMYEYAFIKASGRMSIFCTELYVENKTSFGNKVLITTGGNNGAIFSTINQPSGYNLIVTGGILTEKVKVATVNSASWADYVFNKDYKLLSLGEVEAYIQKNKHLPGVPSAEEVSKEGIDMVTMDAKLLEKIEELTLYMIELKKEIEVLKNRK